jgi:deoxyribonuclease V
LIALVDVHYDDTAGTARAACVVARQWADARPHEERAVTVQGIVEYRPGLFYERELPCVVAVLETFSVAFTTIVVDGYVVLDASGAPGLGAYVHRHFGGRLAVVGVAKNAFRGSDFAVEVLRGTSARPLYVTALGMDAGDAAAEVRAMHGEHRMPTLLARVDDLARGKLET